MYITFKKNTQEEIVKLTFKDVYENFETNKIPVPERSDKFFRTFTKQIDQYQADITIQKYDKENMLKKLEDIHPRVRELLTADMSHHYKTFHIPKRQGGLRKIDAPEPELMELLRDIKKIFEKDLKVLTHNSAFAYVKGRSTKDALMEHQKNESKWFLKLDIKDFFPSCNAKFILNQLAELFPFQILMQETNTRKIISDIVELCLLKNRLPQGTPMSPLLTNLIMLPLDFDLSFSLRNFDRKHFIYTRYADDLLISCKYHFNWGKVQNHINDILKLSTPFRIKHQKTRYGSAAGRNWNLGLMLNKDNKITIGFRKKERLRATIFTFFQDLTNNNTWNTIDTQILLGNISYFHRVEPEYINNLISKYSTKFNKDFYNETARIIG